MNKDFRITPSSGGVGAFIEEIDLAQPLDQGQAQDLRQALGDNGVLFFRDQQLTPEQHLALAERFGVINTNRFFKAVEDHPQIAEVRKEPHQKTNIGSGWHTDHSYDEAPALGSILLARETPQRGGDTLFANMYAAFEGLSEGLRETLLDLKALHSSRHVFGKGAYVEQNDFDGRIGNADAATQDAVHPVVIRHPISGRRALYVNPGFTVRFEGWTEAESRPLLDFLHHHASRPEYTYRFSWRPGSIAFWDNRATWHRAVNDYEGQRRLMHRVTIEGEPLTA